MTEENVTNISGKKTMLAFAINAILALALIILYVLFFNSKSTGNNDSRELNDVQPQAVSTGSGTIAFVNTDVLLEKYELVKKLGVEYDKEQKQKETALEAKTKKYQEDAAYFQESVQKQSLSEESAQRIYEQLMAEQQDLYNLQQQYSAELSQKEFEMNKVLLDSVKNYLTRMNVDNKFDYILNYTMAGSILLAKDTFDITDFVLKGLNKEYAELYQPKK